MKRSHLARICGWCLVGLGLVLGSIVCTKEKKVSQPDIVVPPTLEITNFTTDTLRLSSDSTYIRITGTVTNPDDLDITLTVNDVNILDSLDTDGKFVCTVQLTSDTMSVIVKVTADGKTITDKVWVIKQYPVQNLGKAKLSGTLLREAAAGTPKALAKTMVATNASGLSRVVSSVLPVSGADIIFYDAASLKTSSDTSVETGPNGEWEAELDPGTYFVFAVYFDRENLEIVTASMPNVEALANKETETDTATAISDDVKPMLLAFCDAISADSSGIFVAGDVPQGLPIVMNFSEPMNRQSAGEGRTGIVLGSVDPIDPDLALRDTLEIDKLWGPSSKELRLVPKAALTVGKTYKVYIPSSVKDLALNKLSSAGSGIFKVNSASALPPFAVANVIPTSGDTITAGFPVEFIFTRPVDAISLNAHFTLVCSDATLPQVRGYFDAKGNSAKFTATTPWAQGKSYIITVKSGTKDLLGDTLGSTGVKSIAFMIKPPDQFQQGGGEEGEVSTMVQRVMSAFIAGDIETFAQAFHAQLEVIDYHYEQGDTIEERAQRDIFLEERRADIAEWESLSKYGIISPVWYWIGGPNKVSCWKLTKGTTTLYMQDMGGGQQFGMSPRVFSGDSVDITDSTRLISFVNRGLVYKGDTLIYGVDMSSAFVDQNTRNNDPRIFGKLLREQTNVQTQDVLMDMKQSFTIKTVTVTTAGVDAQVMMEMVTETQYRDGKYPFATDPTKPPPAVQKDVMAIQMKVVRDGGKWMVIQLVTRQVWSGDKTQFTQTSVTSDNFVIQNVAGTSAIDLTAPGVKAVGVASPVQLKWTAPSAKVGGYLVAVSDEMSGGNSGLLMFATGTSVTLNADGSVTGATLLNIDPKSLPVPLPGFGTRLTSIKVADSAVYVWKVVGIPDSTAGSISGSKFMVIADSDFGKQGGVGIFTLLATMPNLVKSFMQPATQPVGQPVNNMFSDRDKDFFPDWIEKAFACNPDDAGEYPNYVLDSDMDGWADFLESKSGSNPMDSTSKPADKNPADGIPDWFQTNRPDWQPQLATDEDRDGFPNEIEMIYGSDPRNATSKPQKIVRPSIPVGKYFGVVEFQGNTSKMKLVFTVASDTSVTIDTTTQIVGLVRPGYPLRDKLVYMGGEWVFFAQYASGPNTGKYLKFRARPASSTELSGAIDLADMVNGGGPYVGNFRVSTDSSANLSQPPVNNNPIGGGPSPNVNLGPPPADRLVRPDSAVSLTMTIMADTVSASARVVLVVDGKDTLVSEKSFWQPGSFPALRFGAPTKTGIMYNLDGNLHLQKDTLVMIGPLNIVNQAAFTNAEVTLMLAGYGSARNPKGVWTGWYRKSTMAQPPQNQGPLPYIGAESGVISAMTLTGKKGVIRTSNGIDSATVVDIIDFRKQSSNMWTAQASVGGVTKQYNLLEKTMGNTAEILVARINGVDVVVLGDMSGGGGPVNPGGPAIYNGDSMTVVNALAAANNQVQVQGPTPTQATVNPASLRKQTDPMGKTTWTVADASDQNKTYMISGDPMNPMNVAKSPEGKVVVMISGTTQNPGGTQAMYTGDSTSLVTALNATQNRVWVTGATPREATVKLASLRRQPDGKGGSMWVVEDQTMMGKMYQILGDPMNPVNVSKDPQNRVQVAEVIGGTGGGTTFYSGDSTTLVTALNVTTGKVWVTGTNPREATVKLPSLRRQPDGRGGSMWVVEDQTVMGKMYQILGDPMNPANVARDPQNRVQVAEVIGGTGGGTTFYSGDSTTLATALNATAGKVWVTGGAPREATVKLPSLRRQPDGKGGSMWVVEDQMQAGKMYQILGDPMNPVNVARDSQNRVQVVEAVGGGTNAMPYAGDSLSVVNALTTSSNRVWVQAPNPFEATVNRATLRSQPDGKGGKFWVVGDQMTVGKAYVIMGEPVNPMNLAKDPQGRVMVMDAPPSGT